MADAVALVEDDAGVREALRDVVRLAIGRPCVALASYAELEARAAEVLRCELVVLDINLGAGVPSGLDCYVWLRERGFRGRVAFLTAHASDHPMVKAAAAVDGALVLRKPVTIDALERLVAGT